MEIIQAMNLVVKHGMKVLPGEAGPREEDRGEIPGLYVKVYLMEGKTCLAKAKTQIVRSNSVSPMIRQRLHFHENPRKKMLQVGKTLASKGGRWGGRRPGGRELTFVPIVCSVFLIGPISLVSIFR